MSEAATTTTINAADPDIDETRLYGRWLLIARVSWILLTLFILALNMVMIPRYDALLQAQCRPGPLCFALQLTAFDRQFLHQFGLSLSFLAAYQVVLDTTSVLICCALGALIFWRKSADRMALFCAFMLVLFGGAGFTAILQDALEALSPGWFVVVNILNLLGQCAVMIFFLLFPSGKFVPRWTRWFAICVVFYWIYALFLVPSLAPNSSEFNPGVVVFFAFLLVVVGVQVYRYRRVSTSRERQQTKWVVYGLSIGSLGFVLFIALGNIFLPPDLQQSGVITTLLSGTIIYSFLLLIPLSIAVAILRSRLYDIDVVINRTLVYGSLTGVLGALYAGLVIGLESLVRVITGQTADQPVALVISTLIIAALFQPARKRIQTIIDHRFYRKKYDSHKTLAAFSASLRSEVDLQQLQEHLLAVVEETMQPAHVSLWMRPDQSAENREAP